ncbi:MAG: alpha/beta hydrolase [Actinomycetota bacterium]
MPHLTVRHLRRRSRAVVLLLHGGAEAGLEPVSRWAGPPLRMVPFGWAIHRRNRRVAVARLRFRRRGWNGVAAHPLEDVRAALERLDRRASGLPVVLVGHSMGGRAAIATAGEPSVLGLVALAPWIPADDPVDQVAGRHVVVIHGSDDQRTSPVASARFAARITGIARSVRTETVPDGDHAMLRHARRWHRLTADAVATMLAAADPDGTDRDTHSAEPS